MCMYTYIYIYISVHIYIYMCICVFPAFGSESAVMCCLDCGDEMVALKMIRLLIAAGCRLNFSKKPSSRLNSLNKNSIELTIQMTFQRGR